VLCSNDARADVSSPHPHFMSLYSHQVFRQKNRAAFGPLLSRHDTVPDRPERSTNG
jgi:hypothetical protein